ncbi:MAG: hypothetical protein ACQEUZ_02145 [Pseudomonadota bacterium]
MTDAGTAAAGRGDAPAGLTAARALALLERGAGADRAGRALLLHAAAWPDAEAGAAPLGDLDRAAWALRRTSLGGAAEALADCAACGAALEVALPADFAPPGRVAETVEVVHGGVAWQVRLPRAGDFEGGRLRPERLAEGAPWSDPDFVARAEAALEAADPGMDLRLGLTCAACGAAAEIPFDAVAFFWRELEALERRLVAEVAALARAYGWSEADILGMSARRRALYLAEAER